MNSNAGEVLLGQELIQCHTTLDRSNKDDHLEQSEDSEKQLGSPFPCLIELEKIQQLEELLILLILLQLNIVLLKTVQSELSLIVHIDFHWLKIA